MQPPHEDLQSDIPIHRKDGALLASPNNSFLTENQGGVRSNVFGIVGAIGAALAVFPPLGN